MDLARLVRRLVVLDIVLLVAGVTLDSQLEGGLPDGLKAYLSAQDEAPLTAYDIVGFVAAVPVLAGMVVGWVGLLRRWKYAPTIWIVSVIASVPVDLLMGPTVLTAFGTAADSAVSIVNGAIAGLLLCPRVREEYRRSAAAGATAAQ